MQKSKVLVSCVCAMAFSSSAFSQGFFMGVEGGVSISHINEDTSISYLGNSYNEDFSSNEAAYNLGLKVGYIFTDDHRAYVSYSYGSFFSSDYSDADAHNFIASYNYTPKIAEKWRGVVGPYLGYSLWNDDFFDTNGFLFGAKVGALYELNINSEIEFGFKVEHTSYSSEDYQENFLGETLSASIKPKVTNYGLYVGYNYKF